jgi:hypothetical protein
MKIIRKLSDINLKLLRIKKPYISSQDTYVFDISYNNSIGIILQSPIGRIPYSYSLYDNNNFKIDIELQDENFYEVIRITSDKVLRKVQQYDNSLLHDKEFVPYCVSLSHQSDKVDTIAKEEISRSFMRLKLKNNNIHNVLAFDSKNEKMSVLTLQTFDKLICLFTISRLIVYKDSYQFQVSLLQVKSLSHQNLQTPSIIEDINHNIKINTVIRTTIPITLTHEELLRYQKMYKFGVSWLNVRKQMLLDDISVSNVNAFEQIYVLKKYAPPPPPLKNLEGFTAPPPPPPPPPGSLKNLNNTILKTKTEKVKSSSSSLEFLRDIKSGNFKLKSSNNSQVNASIVQKHKQENVPKIVGNQLVPSLQDILNTRSRLKKIYPKDVING